METKDIEYSIRAGIAKTFIDNLPDETKNQIMAASVEKTLTDLCTSYSMREEVKTQLLEPMRVYVKDYLEDPEVQAKLKESAHKAVDSMFDAIIRAIMSEMERNIKSKYHSFNKED